jgi:hypothetical protein
VTLPSIMLAPAANRAIDSFNRSSLAHNKPPLAWRLERKRS